MTHFERAHPRGSLAPADFTVGVTYRGGARRFDAGADKMAV